jgi:HEAT repeat protein
MLRTRSFVLSVVFVAAVMTLTAARPARVVAADNAAGEMSQPKLIAVLQADAAPQEKAIACKRLAICGTKDAVPSLATLLPDEKLASWARIALEAIPDPAADEALRGAVGKLRGRLLVGVINSLGVRRDVKAVDTLIERLKDADAEVASAAAAALGHIGGGAACQALEQSLASAPAAARSAVAEGCILCAERCLSEGKRDEAVKLYDLVRKAGVPKQRVVEATRGAILARQSAGVPLLVEQLQSADKALLAVGLRVARELPGREATEALVAELGRAAPDRQVLLILALGDRGDAAALPAVLQAARSGQGEVRSVAIRALRRLGNAACVPLLLEAALEADEGISQTAIDVLADLAGKQVDDALAGQLSKAEGKRRQVLMQLAGERNIAGAVPALLKAAEDPDDQIRAAALRGLGFTIEFGDLPVLIARVARPAEKAEEAKAAEEALRAACERMPDREACAGKLAAAMSQAPVAAKCKFLEILTVLGGTKALQAVGAAAQDADPQIQDAASRLLGEWMSVDAGPVLLDLTKRATDVKYESRLLRGYIRLARQFVMPEEQRLQMCRAALAAAKRDEEKKLVIEVLERYPSVETLRLAVEAAKAPSLKNDAARAALVIVEKIGGRSGDVQKLLAQLGHEPVKVEILKAEYGADGKYRDVTEALRQRVRNLPLILLANPSYNASFGGDPVPGVVKQLKVRYRINGKEGQASFPENATIMLPIPP